MSIGEKMKAINNKIKQSKAQYHLDRQTANISALSSGNPNKYKFFDLQRWFNRKRFARKNCCNQKICIFSVRQRMIVYLYICIL